MKVKERNIVIDIAKGIGIILVILGHTGINSEVNKCIYSFHMPLFFLISGSVFKIDKIPEGLKKIYINLFKPYVLFSIIIYILLKIIDPDNINIKNNIILNGWISYALWFIPVLAVTQLSFICIYKRLNYLAIILLLTGYFLGKYNIGLPYKIGTCFIAIFFFTIGYYKKQIILNIHKIEYKYIFLLISIQLFISYLLPKTDLAFNSIGNGNLILFIIAIINAIIGCIYILQFSLTLSKVPFCNTILIFIGRNTLILLSFHQVINLFLKNNLKIENSIFRYLLLFSILYALIIIINRYFKFMIK